jgi:hypothetical protein
MWDPQRPTTLKSFTARYGDKFTFKQLSRSLILGHFINRFLLISCNLFPNAPMSRRYRYSSLLYIVQTGSGAHPGPFTMESATLSPEIKWQPLFSFEVKIQCSYASPVLYIFKMFASRVWSLLQKTASKVSILRMRYVTGPSDLKQER